MIYFQGLTVNASLVLIVMFLPKILILTDNKGIREYSGADRVDYEDHLTTPIKRNFKNGHTRETGKNTVI